MDTPHVSTAATSSHSTTTLPPVIGQPRPATAFGRGVTTSATQSFLGKSGVCFPFQKLQEAFSIVPVIGPASQFVTKTCKKSQELTAVHDECQQLVETTTRQAIANQFSTALNQLRGQKQKLEALAARHEAQSQRSLLNSISWVKTSLSTTLPLLLISPLGWPYSLIASALNMVTLYGAHSADCTQEAIVASEERKKAVALDSRITELERQEALYLKEKETQEKTIKAQSDEITALKQQLAARDSEFHSGKHRLREQAKIMQLQSSKLEETSGELLGRYEDLKTLQAQFEAETRRLEAANTHLRKQYALRNELQLKMRSLEAVANQVPSLTETLKKKSETLLQVRKEANRSLQFITKIDKELKAMQKQFTSAQMKLTATQNQQVTANAQLDNYKAAVVSAPTLQEAKSELTKTTSQFSKMLQLLAEIVEAHKPQTEAREALTQEDITIQQMLSDLNEREDKIQQLQLENNQLLQNLETVGASSVSELKSEVELLRKKLEQQTEDHEFALAELEAKQEEAQMKIHWV